MGTPDQTDPPSADTQVEATGDTTPTTPEAPATAQPDEAPVAAEPQAAPDAADPPDAGSDAPAEAVPTPDVEADAGGATAAVEAPASTGDQPQGEPAPGDQGPAEGEQPAGDQPQGEGEPGAKRSRRRGRRRSGKGGGGGNRRGGRVQWDEVFLRQRLELLRAMPADPVAIEWALERAGSGDVADILAGEGSSGKEFGRRAYAAKPETEEQSAWIVLAAVRARDILPIARRVLTGNADGRAQIAAAVEHLGLARVKAALQVEGSTPQQVFAERARRVDVEATGGAEHKAAWSLLSLARPQDVQGAVTPARPRGGPGGGPGGPGGRPGGPGGGRPGGPGGPGGGRFGDDRRGRKPRREPGIPGGIHTVGGSSGGGVGGQLGEALREALRKQQEAEAAARGETAPPAEPEEAPVENEAPARDEASAAAEDAPQPEAPAEPVAEAPADDAEQPPAS